MSEDFQDSLRTEAFYERPIAQVEADLDAEEADLADDFWAAEEAALEDEAERLADYARDELADAFFGDLS